MSTGSPSASRALVPSFLLLFASLALAFAAFFPQLLPAGGTRADLVKVALVGLSLTGIVLGYRGLAAHGDSSAARRGVLLGAVPLWALAVAVPPYDSIDLHGYTSLGHSQVEYGSNPYTSVVSGISGWRNDPLLRDDQYADCPCAYGFLFTRELAAVVRHAGPDKFPIFLAFKLINVVALALTLWVVAIGCGRLGVSRATGLYLVAWNPIVLLHGISNGHNDILSGLGLVAALALAGSRLWWACPTVLAAGALVKYSTLPLVPLAALYLASRHGWVRTTISVLPAVALVAWAAQPYATDGGAMLISKSMANVTKAHGSIGSIPVDIARALGKVNAEWSGAEHVVGNVWKSLGGMLILGLVGWLGWKRWRSAEYTWAEFVRDAVLVQLVLVVVASAKFFSWYLLMFWPAVAWLPVGSRLRRAAVAVGFAQIGSLMFLGGMNIVNPLFMIVLPLVWAYRTTRSGTPVILVFPVSVVVGRRAA